MGKYGRARDGPDCAKRVARTAALVPGRRRRFAKAPPLGFAVSQHAPDALPSGRLCDARAGATVHQRPGSPLRRGVFRRLRFRAGAVRALKRARVPRRGGAAGAGSPPAAYVRRGVSEGARERATRPRRELPRRAKPATFSCKTGTGPAWGGWTIPGAPARRTRRLFRGGRAGVVQKTKAGRSLRRPVARPARGGDAGLPVLAAGERRRTPKTREAAGSRRYDAGNGPPGGAVGAPASPDAARIRRRAGPRTARPRPHTLLGGAMPACPVGPRTPPSSSRSCGSRPQPGAAAYPSPRRTAPTIQTESNAPQKAAGP